MSEKMIPIRISGIEENIYSGFWSRLGANLLDAIISIPILFLVAYINSLNKNMYFFTLVPNLLFSFWYHIYLPKKHGGTLGKLIVGIKILKTDASSIGWKESFLRYSINIVFLILNAIIMTIGIIFANDEIYNSLPWLQKSGYVLSSVKGYKIFSNISSIWVWSEVIVLLFNKRKRAIHDFIAGTVIIKSQYIEKIREHMAKENHISIII
jgi:uncharacterized RDD family membrane protein YckC